MTPPSAYAVETAVTASDSFGPADIALVLRRGALPVAPLAMPVQPLEHDRSTRALLPRLFASLPLRTGN